MLLAGDSKVQRIQKPWRRTLLETLQTKFHSEKSLRYEGGTESPCFYPSTALQGNSKKAA